MNNKYSTEFLDFLFKVQTNVSSITNSYLVVKVPFETYMHFCLNIEQFGFKMETAKRNVEKELYTIKLSISGKQSYYKTEITKLDLSELLSECNAVTRIEELDILSRCKETILLSDLKDIINDNLTDPACEILIKQLTGETYE